MKIKIFSTFYYPNIIGGGEISTQLLAEGLKEKGVDVEVVTLGERKKIFIHNGVTVKVIASSARNKIYKNILEKKYIFLKFILFWGDFIDILFYKKLKYELKNCDILHITNYHYCSCIPLLYRLKKENIKIIQSIRAPIFQDNKNNLKKIWSKVSMKLYQLYSKDIIFHFPTKYMYNYLETKNIKFNKFFIIGNTVNINIQKIQFENKDIDLCYSGVIEEYKGIRTLINSIKNLKEKRKKIKSIFIGKGSLEIEARKNEIEVTGWLSKEKNYQKIKKSKVLVLPSEWDEAFGRVLVEAIYLGTIVVGSDSGAIPEVLNYNSNYIFKTKNYKELEEKIERILNLSKKEYENEIKFLREEVKKYSYDNHILKFIENYKELLGEK